MTIYTPARVVWSELTPAEVDQLILDGTHRRFAAVEQRRCHRDRMPVCDSYRANALGMLGEGAVAKALGVGWSPNIGGNDKATGDVAGFQVRTASKHHYRLHLYRDGDDDAAPFVLVTGAIPPFGEAGRFAIRGWIYGRDGKRPEWLRSVVAGRPPSYWVPQPELAPFDTRPFL